MNKTLLPKLRFPSYRNTREWEEINVGKLLAPRLEKQVPSENAPLYSLTIEDGITAKSERYNREFLVKNSSEKKYKLVRPNDIVFNPSNLRWGAINYHKLNYPVVVSPIYEVLYLFDKQRAYSGFINYALMRPKQIKQFVAKAQGTLVERIAVKIEFFLETPLPIPPTLDEQQKIADCLTSLDDLIAAQSQKVAALQAYKKGLMQNLFPAAGESVPRLRFPEFESAGEWEVKTLGEVISLEYGSPLPENSRKGGAIPVIGSNGIVGHHDEYIVSGPAIIVGRKGSAGQITWIDSNCYPIDTTFYVQNKNLNDYSMPFLKLALEKCGLERLIDNAAVPGLNRNQVYSLEAPFPKMNEQQRIAELLSAVDEEIAAQGEALAALKVHKKGLMQQLFPSIDEVEE